ncbi:MAG: c-type cytochrome biogenesis protein CcmI [Alteromonas macleodii]|jgi:cytochrome c-type biogenesis protein CcmI|uniref:c-type cytochrome biogenesis protein CcmI n=1 Tax=Alteromonas TaxID=226 RepID=UPI000C4680EF|nr:c-type cytochrome biogenesis protein CcmI [Alteromonas macleodii]MAW04004.1 c-type cytochrome biogenesis protein CcmI [Alteromonas sp.]MDM7960617.1 c-type cytochrome biogenesis protein CcmI [Alteromonas macleodii]MDM8169536.1 c-type cytochrome biogenesis protein CcmI [Alteromonas macleodii]CAI3939052.1 cytochrome c-type biogenesis protein CcmI [Alteromonas macleodii]VTP53146.1 cytochrome c-type biogenesis protein CcmI [Alteromonas macleodii]|tara:strand:+ start:10999 stop:12330 length:1332 start_codon:yes stop_codon:yes gene_type:complete
MSWSEFYIIVSGLITLVLLIVAFPWLRNKSHAKQDSLSNTQIVKQRLAELDREVQEGLISEHDKRQAVDELKLALVDESAFQSHKTGNAKLPLAIGAVLAIACGVIVYAQVNQMGRVAQAAQAIEALPELSQQLASGNANNLTQQDIASLALAIRQRLREEPEDDTGWMYFGRLMLSIGQEVQAIEAIDKAVSLAPSNSANRITLAQALMTTGDVNNLERAQSILLGLLNDNPANDNLALMMAVVSAQLGDLENTQRFYKQVEGKLPADSDMAQRLVARIKELQGNASVMAALQNTAAEITDTSTAQNASSEAKNASSEAQSDSSEAQTGFNITVNLSDDANTKAPKEGFLIVFAQDANSDNKMPAAVVKLPIEDFPVSVTLTTENAMMPQFTLATLSDVVVTARLSKDGNVAVAKGEWQGSVSASVTANEISSLSVIIDKEL